MEQQPLEARGRHPARLLRISAAGVFLLLAAASVIQFNREGRIIAAATRFEQEFSIDLRWPWVKATGKEPVGDLAADIAVEAALRDTPENVPEVLSPILHQSWLHTLSRRREELQAARELMLAAIATRPAWAYHKLLLANLVLAETELPGDADRRRERQLAAETLRQASRGAPGLDAIWVSLGALYSHDWQDLSEAARREAFQAWRRAFVDSNFVSGYFMAVVAVVGRERAIDLLPDTALLLEEAAKRFSQAGDLQAMGLIAERIRDAQKKDRAALIHRLEEANRAGNTEDLRAACLNWTSVHPVGEFDDRAGRAQDARILELWPADANGSWQRDPRARFIQFFLKGRESDVHAAALVRAMASLYQVPEAIRARVRLLAGDWNGAEEIASRAENLDPVEWTPYFVELSRFQMKRGSAGDARKALERSGEGQEDCDLLLAKRDVARALQDQTLFEATQQALDHKWTTFDPHSGWSAMGTLSVCIDPERVGTQTLPVNLTADSPAIAAYGADGGRSGTLAVGENAVASIPLREFPGGRTFEIQTLVGGPVRVSDAALQRAP